MAYGKKESREATPLEQTLIWLREDLVGELEAINQYQWHIDNIDNEEIKGLLAHIRDDEKEHVAELTHLITRVDEIQKEKFLEDHTAGGDHVVGGEAEEAPAMTVDSLFGKK